MNIKKYPYNSEQQQYQTIRNDIEQFQFIQTIRNSVVQ